MLKAVLGVVVLFFEMMLIMRMFFDIFGDGRIQILDLIVLLFAPYIASKLMSKMEE